MKNKLRILKSTALLVLVIFNSIISAQEITYKAPKNLEPRIKQKTKIFFGFNYENYRTSFYSKEANRYNKIIDSTLSTVNEGISRIHIRYTYPFNYSRLFKNFVVDMMIPFATKEQNLDKFSLNSSYKKFNVLEIDIGVEFEF